MKARRALKDSLYDKLAMSPAPGPIAGRTNVTRAKETIDNDVEEFALEDLLCGS